jgi:hypothetical protein
MKNIHLIPASKPSRLFKFANELHLDTIPKDYYKKYNIYITCDEEIKDGEYGLSRLGEIIKFHSGYDYRYYAKIILTTDQDLIADGVQAIDDEFLEWFVKNPSCERVEVEKQMLCDYCGQEHCDNLRCRGYKDSVWYEIIIPQEEPKYIEDEFEMQSRIINKVWDEESKQETLEEAAKEGYNNMPFGIGLIKRRSVFLLGAKWQAKRMYSEEEVLKLVDGAFRMYASSHRHDAKEWLVEQFKKK